MPGKNLVKTYADDSYYHIYNRGVNGDLVFIDNEDKAVFLNLFKRYLSDKPEKDLKGREYAWLQKDIQLLAFCLMGNHYHLLVYQKERDALTRLMRAVNSSYGMYFNNKYKRKGPLFQSYCRASLIDNQAYLDHISRYIHLNPGKNKYKIWNGSSLPYYEGSLSAEWVNPKAILDMFPSKSAYLRFVADYEDMHDELDILKHELANY